MRYFHNSNFICEIDTHVYEHYMSIIRLYDFHIESGGILIGTMSLCDNKINITDFTVPQKKDRQTRFGFKRMEYGHQEIMDKLWMDSQEKKTYLGEWHTHDEPVPCPSPIDISNWIAISKRPKNSNCLAFVIVGRSQIRVWTVIDSKVVEMRQMEDTYEN